MNENNHYRYVINFENGCYLKVDLLHGKLIRMAAEINEEPKIISLRTTKMKLLCYLLENANHRIVSREELLTNVWEAHNLSSSYPRLLQVVNKLKDDLQCLDVPDDFINYYRGRGYGITCGNISSHFLIG